MRSKRSSTFLLIAVLFLVGLVAAHDLDARSSTTALSFDVIHYAAEIEPSLTNKSIRGRVIVRFRSLANDLREIQLNAGALEIDAVTENKRPLRYEKKDELLNISFERPAKTGETHEIEIGYHGNPKYGIRFFPEQVQIYTVFSTSQWMPCVDAPSDRATFRLTLITPKDLKVVGNGRMLEQKPMSGGRKSTEWEQAIPVPSYVFGFAAGQFREVTEIHKGIELRSLTSPRFSESEVKQIFKDSKTMLDFFESKAGIKYPGKEYTQALATGGPQQEMSGFAVMNDEYGRGVLENERENWLAAHELSHQWWGNMVTSQN